MRCSRAVFGILAASCLSTSAVAEESARRFFGQAEFWSTSDAFEAAEDAAKELVSDMSTPYMESKTEIKPGFGVRFGFSKPTSVPLLRWGGSLGYVKGPDGTFEVNDGAPVTERINETAKTSFIRLLAELTKDVSLGRVVDLRLGAGLGLAHGNFDGESTSIGSYAGDGSLSVSKTWTGLSWELSPSLIVKGSSADFEIGLMLAGFPALKEDDDVLEFKWTPFGVKVGVHF